MDKKEEADGSTSLTKDERGKKREDPNSKSPSCSNDPNPGSPKDSNGPTAMDIDVPPAKVALDRETLSTVVDVTRPSDQKAAAESSLLPMDIENNGAAKNESDGPESDNRKNDATKGVTSSEASEDDSFSNFTQVKRPAKKRGKQRKKIKISLKSVQSTKTTTERVPLSNDRPSPSFDLSTLDHLNHYTPDDNWLDYYCDTHDDQDPAFIERELKRHQEALDRKLKTIDEGDMAVRKEIDRAVNEMLEEKKAQLERNIELYKERILHDQRKLSAKLEQRHKDKMVATNAKINQKVKQLQMQHQKEMTQLLESHRREIQARRMPPDLAQSEWSRKSQITQGKHQQQHQKLTVHTDEYKRRAEADHKKELDKLRRYQEQKLGELQAKRTSVISDLGKQFTSSKQKHLKRHLQSVMKEKERMKEESMQKTQQVMASTGEHVPPITTPRDLAKSAVEHKEELRPPSPFRSIPHWYRDQWMHKHQQSLNSSHNLGTKRDRDDMFETSVGAAMRHKQRKGVLSAIAQQTHVHLTIELHNEGLWIDRSRTSGSSVKSDSSSGDKASAVSADGPDGNPLGPHIDFLEWGPRAFDFLESVINGEIPLSLVKNGRPLGFPSDSFMAQTSGQVICAVTDLRTSDTTAKQQRAEAMQEQEHASVLDLEKRATEFNKMFNDNQRMLKEEEKQEKSLMLHAENATKDLDKSKKHKEEFLRRYRNYLGPDGRPLAHVAEKDQRDLENKVTRLDTNISAALEKEKAARDRYTEIKKKVQKRQQTVKTSQRTAAAALALLKTKRQKLNQKTGKAKISSDANSERMHSPRVRDVMEMLVRVTQKRRDQHNQKKSQNISSKWLQSHPHYPESVKKNTWRKLHRRRLQTVLRPTMTFFCNELRSRFGSPTDENGSEGMAKSPEEQFLKAEELFLRFCHPEVDDSFSSVIPTSKSTEPWREPGWHLDLSVPKDEENLTNILPRARRFQLLERNLTENCSVPGRQAASFLSASHLRSLQTPLSMMGIISSPGEIATVLETPSHLVKTEMDPLSMTDADVRSAYTYTPKPSAPPPRNTSQSRRKSAKDESMSASTGSKASTRTSSSSTSDRPEKKRRVSKADSSPRKRAKKQETNTASTKPQPASTSAPAKPAVTSKLPAGAKSTPTAAGAKPTVSAAQQQRSKMAVSSPQQKQQQQQPKPRQTPPSRSSKPKPIQTQIPTANTGQPQPQPSYPSPHQRQQQQQQQQQMAQLRMMQQARPGFQPPPPGSIQQMQQFYAPLNHPNGPSPRGTGQYRPAMSPNMGRMQPASGHAGMAMPMHPQGMPMPGPVGQPPIAGRGMQAPGGSPQALGVMPPAPGQQTHRSTNAPPQPQARPPPTQPTPQQQQPNTKPQDASQKDQNDPLFMLK